MTESDLVVGAALGVLLVFGASGVVRATRAELRGRPHVVLTEKGIDFPPFGLIPWSDVESASLLDDRWGRWVVIHHREPERAWAALPWFDRLGLHLPAPFRNELIRIRTNDLEIGQVELGEAIQLRAAAPRST